MFAIVIDYIETYLYLQLICFLHYVWSGFYYYIKRNLETAADQIFKVIFKKLKSRIL